MAKFHPLTVTDVKKTIRDAVIVTLQPENPADFAFAQGQYLTFRKDFDGTEVRRNYSICSGLDDGVLQVGIKRVDGGAFSTFANEELKPGDVLDVMPPMGRFYTELEPEKAKTYLGFAGGSGITPVLSILKTVLTREPLSQFTLVYANRAPNTIMFREELEDLKNRFMERLTILHILESGDQDIDLFSGRIDAEKCEALFAHWVDVESVDLALICGPEPMMKAIAAALEDNGLAKENIKYELFTGSQEGQLAAAKRAEVSKDTGTETTVIMDGTAHQFTLPPGVPILQGALENDLDAPHACRSGVCSTCKAKVIEGEAEMIANHALEDYEVRAGFVLTCQCYPISDKIVLDYDQH
ncbi:2Fe-2S iron-sulfur cluster binding domain-containing protein [Aliishimia ponticola]|uniref:2Fe-2S iron-sulfur cluster binding domain-containing protein n=1 Tax=Aliishimia ponticola TaxID=2499833 RepID=A0A4S4NF64_9RHOB|nr:2Fe-2S iron-sulfur cluster-binding protein [Aliishimia ponticola]THH34710.1 2Fe-2S iron-sulfur cluster binding domain-containing protein [Aliishimia ponticola]